MRFLINVNRMSLKDFFSCLYRTLPIFGGPLTQNISDWVMDLRPIFRHCVDVLKMILEAWSPGFVEGIFHFRTSLRWCWACRPWCCITAWSSLLLIWVVDSPAPITAAAFLSVESPGYLRHLTGTELNACGPLDVPHVALWPWTLCCGLHFMRNILLPLQKKTFPLFNKRPKLNQAL